jgi:hypothetical protein
MTASNAIRLHANDDVLIATLRLLPGNRAIQAQIPHRNL